MATLRVNDTGYLVMSDRVTTPSIIIQGVGYIPLFQSSSDTIDYLSYRYTLGNLRVNNYRAAISRTLLEDDPEITPSINHSPTVTIRASSTKVSSGTEVTLTAYASDPDGDNLSYEWSTGATSRSIMVSASGTTRYYNCTVYDSHGGSATSNTVKVSWYDSMKRNWTD